jgi:ubiquinone/menaquinone biosynthesis C-methylase UbiE
MIDKATKRAQEAGADIEFQVGDAHDLSQFSNDYFDAARSAAVFHVLKSPEKAVKEMARIVKPGGRVGCMESDAETISIDHPDVSLTRQILNYHCDNKHQSGWVGRQLPGLFKRAGLEVHVAPATVVFMNHALANLILGFEKVANKMQVEGHISQKDAQGWLSDLTHYDSQGLFFASITGFITKGIKKAK